MNLQVLQTVFVFVGGLGMFLYGMNVMADGLQKSAGNKMKSLLGYLTNNRLLAVVVGALVTAIIQSSSATTIMVVGFVNAGILNLAQAAGVIMGANIGTTITSWLVSMNEWGSILKPSFFAPLVIGIGAFMMFAKGEKKKEIGEILIGFGVLFIGLDFMSDSIKPYRDSKVFINAFTVLGRNPILGILTGAVVTAIIQSSSASVGILQTLAMNGIVNWNSAVFITLGQNIGTCVTAMLSSIGANKTAKRAATIHLLFNMVGAIFFGVIMFIIFKLNTAYAQASINSVQISIFHSVFNMTNTILLFPFGNLLVKLSGIFVKDKIQEEKKNPLAITLSHLDDRILETPSFALENAVKEVNHMGEITLKNATLSVEALLENDMGKVNRVIENEKVIDQHAKVISEYLVKLSNLSLTEHQHFIVNNLFYNISDIERVGDHSENLAELALERINHNIRFSDQAYLELGEICKTALYAFENSLLARQTEDLAYVIKVSELEDIVDQMEDELREKHIERLSQGVCDSEAGIVFIDAIVNLERISDHSMNIANYVKDELESI